MFPGVFFEKMTSQIENLKTAVFSDFSESIVKFPNSIIRIISANEDGKIWFLLPKPYLDISGIEKKFPATLRFYNKKYNYYVNVEGVAELISNVEAFPDKAVSNFALLANKDLLIRVRISRMEYFEKGKSRKANLFDPLVDLFRWVMYRKGGYHFLENQPSYVQ
jgi:hypothetical protein